jgi:hypothetical protein
MAMKEKENKTVKETHTIDDYENGERKEEDT